MNGYRGFAALCLLLIPALAACFDAPRPDIGFRCGAEGQCPAGYECRDTGCCHRIGSPEDVECPLAVDGAVNDGSVVDASGDAMGDGGVSDAMADGGAAADSAPEADAMPPMLVSLLPSPLMVTTGMTGELTVTLSSAAPSGGITVDLMSNNTATATVPASVTVLEGATTAAVTVTGVAPGSTTIDASYSGDTETANVTVAATAAAAGEVIFTEFLALEDSAVEFVELRNVGSLSYDITGWQLDIDAIDADEPIAAAALDGSRVYIAPGERLWGVPNPALATDIPGGADFVWDEPSVGIPLPDGGALLILELANGNVIDSVDYSGWQTTPGATPSANQFAGLEDRSTQLAVGAENATDNDDGASWCVPAAPTRGTANASCTAAVINEALAEPTGGSANNEFVEISAVPGGDLSGWVLRATDSSGAFGSLLSVTFAAGTRVPLDGYLVYADASGGSSSVANADVEGDSGLVGDGDGGLQLVLGSALIDALGFGAVTDVVDESEGLPIHEGAPETAPTEGSSNARDSSSTDSNNNAADFSADATPSPGAAI